MKKTGIIVALDDMDEMEGVALAQQLSGKGLLFKGNDILDSDMGLGIIPLLNQHGGVMADPKLYDIPKTVANRTKKFAKYGPVLLTVHASGGIPMMQAAVANCGNTMILGVTVLTSFSSEECILNFGNPPSAEVLKLARDAALAGAHGIVCSPEELAFLRKFPELKNLIRVTPGIRPKWHLDPNDDQARIATPAYAVRNGADYIVIGRPITMAKDPIEAAYKTIEEVKAAMAELEEEEEKTKGRR